MNYWSRIACFICLGIVTVACSMISTPAVTTIPMATDIQKATAITTPKFAQTPSPTVTSYPAIEATQTIPPGTMAVVATIEAIVTEKPDLEKFYSRACIIYGGGVCSVSNLGLSPNGNWAVFYSGRRGLSIVNVASKKQWDIDYSDINSGYQGEAWVEIEHWSHDDRYLYVSPRMAGDGGMFWFWRDYIQLVRLNLENGTWVDTKMGSSFSFSPDDKFIAYRRGTNLVIYEFQTGNERKFNVPTEYAAFGRFVWSQDSKQIMFVSSSVEELNSGESKPNGFTLFLLDVEKMKAEVILEKDERYLYPLKWQTSNFVLLESLYGAAPTGYLEYSGEKYKLDLGTNEISKYESS